MIESALSDFLKSGKAFSEPSDAGEFADEIAKRLDLTPRQVYRLREAGAAPFIVKLGGRLCAREAAIQKYFDVLENKDDR